MRAGKGFSLVELLIGAALLGLFMTSIVAALYYCNRYLKTAEAKISAQGQCLQATMWLSRTINESNFNAITIAPGTGVCFASPRVPGSGEVAFLAGKLVWQQTMAYYLTTSPVGIPILVAKSFPYASGNLDPEPPLSVPLAVTSPSIHERVIARYVKEFQIEAYAPTNSDPDLRNSTRIAIECYLPYYNSEYSVKVRTQVRIEN